MNRQEVFDKVAIHLLTQNAKALNSGGLCVYKTPNGLRCAVGCLIPDGHDALNSGADAFALMVLAIIAPQFTLSENVITPFTTLSNAAILFVVPLLINVLRNIVSIIKHENIFEGFDETRNKKIIAMFIGYRSKKPKYGFSIERKKRKVKKFHFSFHHAENAQFEINPNTVFV